MSDTPPPDDTTSTPADPPSSDDVEAGDGSQQQGASVGQRMSVASRLITALIDPDGAESGRSRRMIWAGAVFAILLAMSSAVWGIVINNWFAAPTVRAQKEAEERIEADSAPFNAQFDFLWDPLVRARLGTKDAYWVKERELSAGEVRQLQHISPWDEPSAPLRDLGVRPVDPDHTLVRLTLTSDRVSALVITDIRVRRLNCWTPKAEAAFYLTNQGGGEVDAVSASLDHKHPVLRNTEDGTPYFVNHDIALGQGLSHGHIIIDMSSSRSCHWSLIADYYDSHGRYSVKLPEQGQPLLVEAIPQRPAQEWGPDYEHGRPGQYWIDISQ